MRPPKGQDDEDTPIVTPPHTFTVDYERKPVLYLPDGRVLVRRPPGFVTKEPR